MSIFELREVAHTEGAPHVTVRVYVGRDSDHLAYAGTLTVRNTPEDPELETLQRLLGVEVPS
jgi:hypothetical protein